MRAALKALATLTLAARRALILELQRAGAGLLLLEANPLEDIRNTTRVIGVARAGRWYDRPALDRLLAGVRERKL